jgi:hypothetical protein
MPLPDPAPRERVHCRSVRCEGFRRADGLWDVEGWLVDTKDYGFDNAWRGRVEAGVPVHGMGLCLTLDDDLTVVAAVAVMDHHPYEVCPRITPAFEKLVGLRIGAGWRRAVQERLGGIQGCTHLVELLGPMATTAYQTILPLRARRPRPEGAPERPPGHLDGCHALRRDGEVVRRFHPRWYTGEEEGGG